MRLIQLRLNDSISSRIAMATSTGDDLQHPPHSPIVAVHFETSLSRPPFFGSVFDSAVLANSGGNV